VSLPFDLDAEVARLVRQKLIELPTYPGVALKLQRMLANPEWNLSELTSLVQADQALSTYAVRTANSAYYPSARPVTTLAQAITRIGAKGLSNIAIAGTLGLRSEAPGALAALRKESWRSSLLSSLLCQELAPGRKLDPGEAFLAGLLHGFGETLAYGCFESILLGHPGTGPQPLTAWQHHGQRHQLELGTIIASEWKLPDFVVEAVRRHADPDLTGCRHPELIRLVALSDRLARMVLEAPGVEQVALDRVELSEAERRQALGLIPRLPDILQSFEATTTPPAAAPPGAAQAPRASLVEAAESQLGPSARPVDFELKVGKKGTPGLAFRACEWSPTGLRLRGTQPLPERHLVNLDLGSFSVLANVLSCTATDQGTFIEVKPFAMDRKTSALWEALGGMVYR
jgi:HD-like signal output (HDOD) protein